MKQAVSPTLKSPKISPALIFSFLGLIGLFLLLRWNTFTIPFERDEGEYAYSAWIMSDNQFPYEDSFLQKPPMIIYIFRFSQFLAGDSIVLPRILATLSVFGTIAMIGLFVARIRTRFLGFAAMWLMVPMVSLPAFSPFAANTEVFMLFPLSIALVLHSSERRKSSPLISFFAGCCAALAVLFKPIAGPVLLFIGLVWEFEVWKKTGSMKQVALHSASGLGGVVIMAALVLFPFLLHDGGKAMWECVIDYNIAYSSFQDTGSSPIFVFLTHLWKNWWFVFILLGLLLVMRPERWWFLIGALVVSFLTIFKATQWHYLLLLTPFLAAIIVLSLDSLFLFLKRAFRRHSFQKKLVVIIVLLILFLIPNWDLIGKQPVELMRIFYGIDNPFLEAQYAAIKVKAITSDSDHVFVAGSEPEVLYYAHRRSPSRFVIVYPLMIPTSVAKQYQEETIRSLESSPPELMVIVRSPQSWLGHPKSPQLIIKYINTLVASQYSSVGGVLRGSGAWIDKPTSTETEQCSMLLYRRSHGGSGTPSHNAP